ncbi:DUF541 domain-containing protein [candidate division WWE3 bacterium]|uniref:DUF541 domain-containing protein n=1 Tax=candidate division WWE3 bacterium TaxID=2053526 RepID=A0A3A4ZBK9_UNCKA|nr:MAG: DUF541 domain-containing protein [candidate division WWE3 bacterium]
MYREGRTVEVSGSASVSAPPDVFTVILEVSSTRDSASLAQGDVTGQCSKLIDSLINLGLQKKAISTERFSVTPDYELIFDDNRREVKLKGFKASSWMTINSRELDLAGRILDVVVDGGLTQIHSAGFGATNWQEHAYDALRDAAKDARMKAIAIAEGLGVNLGNAVSVTTDSNDHRSYYRHELDEARYCRSETSPVATPDAIKGAATIRATFKLLTGSSKVFQFTNKDSNLWFNSFQPNRRGKRIEDVISLSENLRLEVSVEDLDGNTVVQRAVLSALNKGQPGLKVIEGKEDWRQQLGTYGGDYLLVINRVSYV